MNVFVDTRMLGSKPFGRHDLTSVAGCRALFDIICSHSEL
jgi:hypothetical protein